MTIAEKANSSEEHHETVLILDFGGQYTQLIARRVRELGIYSEIQPCDLSLDEIVARRPVGLILSGGPQSVYEEDAAQIDPRILQLGIPVLGICYGMHVMAHSLGGTVAGAEHREYGRTEVDVIEPGVLFDGLKTSQTVWMSHGDSVAQLPDGFHSIAGTSTVPIVALEDPERRLYGIQFHPEVSHTDAGTEMLRNFLYGGCSATGDWEIRSILDESIADIRDRVGDSTVLCGISGGVDSSVVAVLLKQAIGEQLQSVFVDTGLLRKGEREQVLENLRDGLGLRVHLVDAKERFMSELAGVEEPETKRKIIGRVFIEVFEEAAKQFESVDFLAQGTLYPDVIESESVKGPSAVIKTHHNVGGLPERLGFKLVEPIRMLFKDEVRSLGRELGIPEELIGRHPFPGPGLAVRILGAVDEERVRMVQEADAIFIEELRSAGLYDQVSQALTVFLPVRSVGVMGDFRTYEHVIVLRAVETQDFMTADWSVLPAEMLARTSSRIVNEVRGINRVVYDITSKPPGTIEWE